jgi:hypothetical protein
LDSSVLSNVVLPHADALDCVRFTLPLAQFAGVCDTTHLLNDVQPVPLALVHATPPTASGTDKHAEQLAAPAEEYVQFAHVPQLVAVPPALYVPAEHCVQVCPLTIDPASACNAVVIVALPHAVALLCALVKTPAEQFELIASPVLVSLQLAYDFQPVPLALVHPDSTAKHAEQLVAPAEEYVQFAHVPQLVAVPPALYVPAAHCVQVFWDFKIIGPATNLPVPELIKNLLLTVSYIPNTPSLSRFAGIRLTFVPSVSIIKL